MGPVDQNPAANHATRKGIQKKENKLQKLKGSNWNVKSNSLRKEGYPNESVCKTQVQTGPNPTLISDTHFQLLDWSCYKNTTSDLCHMVFGRETLGTYSLTGRPGRFSVLLAKHSKPKLNSSKLKDIVFLTIHKFQMDRKQVARWQVAPEARGGKINKVNIYFCIHNKESHFHRMSVYLWDANRLGHPNGTSSGEINLMEIIDPSTRTTTVAQLNDANRIWKWEAAFPSNECKEKAESANSGFWPSARLEAYRSGWV